MSNIQKKAKTSVDVNRLLSANYERLYNNLVRTEKDQDTFQDTYLNLTNSYDQSKDFCEQFREEFSHLKKAYKYMDIYTELCPIIDDKDEESDSVLYAYDDIEEIDDSIEYSAIVEPLEEIETVEEIDKNFDLIDNLLSAHANIKESKKSNKKGYKGPRKTKDILVGAMV